MKILCLFLMLPMLALAPQKTAVSPPGTPAGGTSSPGILSEGTLYVSGQTGEDAKTHQIPANFDEEMKNCLSNVKLVLQANGMDFKDAVGLPYRPEPRTRHSCAGNITYPNSLLPEPHIEITVTAHK
jgi:hypothetical protein